MTNERVIGPSISHFKNPEAMNEALQCAQEPKNEREMVLVFHQNGRSTVSASLIAPGSRLVDSAGEPQTSLFQQFSLDTSPQSALAVPPPLALGLSRKSFLRLATHQPAERERLRVRQQSQYWVWAY